MSEPRIETHSEDVEYAEQTMNALALMYLFDAIFFTILVQGQSMVEVVKPRMFMLF